MSRSVTTASHVRQFKFGKNEDDDALDCGWSAAPPLSRDPLVSASADLHASESLRESDDPDKVGQPQSNSGQGRGGEYCRQAN